MAGTGQFVGNLTEWSDGWDGVFVESYYSLIAAGFPTGAKTLTNMNCSCMAIVIFAPDWFAEQTRMWIEQWNVVQSYFPNESSVEISVTGDYQIYHPIADALIHDLAISDAISIPLALLAYIFTVRSVRFSVFPLLGIISGILLSFVIMLPVSKHMDVIAFAPNLQMSISIAMGVDYSLFILSRFAEEVQAGRTVLSAVKTTMFSSGHTILVSGLTLIVCLLGLLYFPIDLLSSMGLGAATAVFSCLVCNLTLVPTLLLAFPNFWANGAFPLTCLRGKGSGHGALDETSSLLSLDNDEDGLDTPMGEELSLTALREGPILTSFWGTCGISV